MTELLKVPTEGGGYLLVEVDDDEPGFEPVSRDGAITEARKRFEDSLRHVRAAANSALDVFTTGPLRPEKVDIEFGVRLNAEAGAVISKTSIEGHLVVRLTWAPDRHSTEPANKE